MRRLTRESGVLLLLECRINILNVGDLMSKCNRYFFVNF